RVVVHEHHLAVGRELRIELEHAIAVAPARVQRHDRVLGREPPGAAVGDVPGIGPGGRAHSCTRSGKRAARFSRKCATPSLKSGRPKLASIAASAADIASGKPCTSAAYTCAIITASERGRPVFASMRAYSQP